MRQKLNKKEGQQYEKKLDEISTKTKINGLHERNYLNFGFGFGSLSGIVLLGLCLRLRSFSISSKGQ